MTNLRSGLFILVIASGCTMAAAAFAQAPGSTTGAGIDAREANQQRRIQQGIGSGSINPNEAARLERREQSIERQEQRMRARDGGELTARDRAVLNHRLDRTNGAIYRAKHNNR
jgi:TolA-binding protein